MDREADRWKEYVHTNNYYKVIVTRLTIRFVHSSRLKCTNATASINIKIQENLISCIYSTRSRGILVSIVTRLRDGRPGFDSSQGRGRDVLSSPPHPNPLCSPSSLISNEYRGINWPRVWSWPLTPTSSPPHVFMEWCLVNQRDNLTLHLSVMF
jgi:hypothetical protein